MTFERVPATGVGIARLSGEIDEDLGDGAGHPRLVFVRRS